MARVTVNYKDRTLISMVSSGTKTLLTNDKYCEDNFQITYTGPSLHSKTVTPTESAQYIYPSSSYDGLSRVTVNGISSNYIGTGINRRNSTNTTFSSTTGTFTAPAGYYSSVATKTITTQAAQTITPTTTSQYISSYRWLTGSQTIAPIPSAYIIPSNTLNITSNGVYNVYGYSSASVNIEIPYHDAYKRIAYKSNINSNMSNIMQSFFDTISSIPSYMFANISMYSNFSFPICTQIETMGFGHTEFNTCGTCTFDFPELLSIGRSAFRYQSRMTTISAPKLTYIGTAAFEYCWSLTTINFPNVTLISDYAFCSCRSLTSINTPKLSLIGDYAFSSCSSLLSVAFSNVTSIGRYAFHYCSYLSTVDFPQAEFISAYAFYSCYRLTTTNFSKVLSIGSYAFQDCSSLTEINFPNCIYINNCAFSGCIILTSVNFPNCTSIGAYTFRNCFTLSTTSFPKVISIGAYAFAYCSSLTMASFPSCTSIGSSAFYSCNSLINVNFQDCTSIDAYAFAYCSSLITASFPKTTFFSNYVFRDCVNLISLYLNNVSSVPTFGYSMFASTPISNYSTVAGRYGSIFVPSSLYTAFTTATSWSAYSARMVSI